MSGTPAGLSAFGSSADDLGDAADILTQGLDLEANGPAETPEPEAAPTAEAPAVEAPAEQPSVEGEQQIDQPQTEAERLLAGKYKTAEELEAGYREQSRLVREKAAAAAQAERRLLEQQEAIRVYLEQEQQRQAAQPAMAPAAGDPTDAQLAAWNMDRATYNAVKPIIDAAVESRVAPLAQQQQQQLTAAQQQFEQQRQQQESIAQQAQAERVFTDFYSRHTDFAPNTDNYEALVDRIQGWNQAWTGDPSGQAGGSLDVTDPTALDIAVEAVKRPALGLVLEANPNLISTDAGMNLARVQADLLEAQQRAQTQPAGTTRAAQTLPHVESGSSGGGPRPMDAAPQSPIDEIVALAEREKSSSIFAR